MKNIKRLKKKL
jgi:hypothetical protein